MKKLFLILWLALLMPCITKAQGGGPPFIDSTSFPLYQSGKIYLKIKNSSSFDLAGYPHSPVTYDADLVAIMSNYGVTRVEKPFVAFNTPTFDRTYRLTFNDVGHTDDLIAALSGLMYTEYSEKVPAMYEQFVSNDPTQPYYLALMNANGASNIHISAGTSVVAIVDDAVLTTHLDLAANIGPLNQDVADLDANANPPLTGSVIVSPGTFSHGTHVAGIAGGVTNNSYGVASIGWNNRIMAVKARQDTDPTNSIPFGYDGITWAATNGADVINCSWGGGAPSLTEYNVVVAANALDVVIVAAAGNSYSGSPFYPAAFGEGATGQPWEVTDRKLVIAVAGLDSNNDRSFWTSMPTGSNSGFWVDISAYGTAIPSCVGGASGGFPINTQFATWNGTSMAAPQISGVAGIMRSYNTVATADEIYDCLVYTANPDIYNATLHPTNTPGTLGTGRVNAEAALQCINEVCPSTVAIIVPSSTTICPSSTVTLTANTGIGYLWSPGGATTQSINVTTAGTYTVTVTFAGGCTSTASVTLSNVSTTPLTLNITETSGDPNDGIMCGPGSSANGFSFCASAWGSSYTWSSFAFMGWGQCSGGMSLGGTVPDTFTMCITVNDMYGCPGLNATACATINAVNPPIVSVTPTSSTVCAGQPTTLTASGAMTYSWAPSTGLSATTGATVIASPTVTTTYTVTGVNLVDGCDDTQTITITVLNPVVVAFSYTGSPYCSTATNPFPTFSPGGVAGTFSSTPGLVFVSTSTGQINLAASTPGTYTVTNTVAGSGPCPPVTATSTIIINAPPVATFSYTGSPFCTTASNPSPVFSGGGVAGTFSSTAGLVFVSTSTGQINLSASTPGTYTITNTVNGAGCPSAIATTIITINSCAGICTTCPAILDTYAPGGILSATPPALQTYCLLGNITVTGAVTILLSEVGIAPNVTITVDPGATLTISGSHLFSCADMWRGIVVKPGGRVSVQNFTLLSINRSSLVEDAYVAIDVQSGSPVTSALVNINNATFNRNQIGLRVAGYQPALGTYPFTVVNSVFTSRAIAFTYGSLAWPQTNAIKATYAVFNPLQTPYINDVTYPDLTAGAYLKGPFPAMTAKPTAHISLNKVGLTINPSTAPTYYEMKIGTPGVPNYNVFDNMGIGIDALNSNFTCVNNVFQRTISPQKNTAAINALANEVFNCRLQAIPAASTNFINKFYDCNIAISATNYFEVNAKYCDLRSLQNFGTHFTNPHRGQNGFIVNTNRYIAINLSNNSIYNIENAIIFQSNIGFYSVGPWTSGSGQYSGKVDINQNTMQPFVTGSPLAGSYINRCITANNVTGTVHFINSTDAVNTNNNTLTDVHNGIRATNWQKKSVITNSNIINMIAVPGAPSATQQGIAHLNNVPMNPMSNNVKSNTVVGYGITNANITAILTQLCNQQVVSCNTTRNVTSGITFSGNEVPTIFSNNTFDNSGTNRHKYAYTLDNNGIIGQQGNGPGTSSSPQTPSDNRWTGTWVVNTHYKTLAKNGSMGINSKLWVRSSANYNPSGGGYNTSLFPNTFANEYNVAGAINITTFPTLAIGCPIAICIPCVTPAAIAKMEQIANDAIGTTVNVAATRVIGKNQLYRTLKNDPSYLSGSSILRDFMNTSETENRGKYVEIEENLVNDEFADAQAKVDGVLTNNAIDEKYVSFYSIYLKQQTDSLVDADSSTLREIASGCPFTDGAIVYQARALYNAVYDVNKEFEDQCINIEERSSITQATDKSNFDAELFPNPSTGEVTINLSGFTNEQMAVIVKDLNGKVVYSDNLQLSNGMSNFKLDISNGVYFVHITNSSNNETIIKKLAIQK